MNLRSGLSLFELLISLALLALLSVGLAAALNVGVQLYARTTSIDDSSEEIALRSRLRHWLTLATPPNVLAPFAPGLVGTSSEFEFVTLAETAFAPEAAGLRVSVTTETGRLKLVVMTLDDHGEALRSYENTLARDASGARFTYFNMQDDPPAWGDTWDDTTRLPDLVRIEIDAGSTPQWPEFTVRPSLR